MRASTSGVITFGEQMAIAAALAESHPQVGEQQDAGEFDDDGDSQRPAADYFSGGDNLSDLVHGA